MAGFIVSVRELDPRVDVAAVRAVGLIVDQAFPAGMPGLTRLGRHADGSGIGEHVNGARDADVPGEPDRQLAEAEKNQAEDRQDERELDERLSGASRFARGGL